MIQMRAGSSFSVLSSDLSALGNARSERKAIKRPSGEKMGRGVVAGMCERREAGGGGVEPEVFLEAIILPVGRGDLDDGGGAVGRGARGGDLGGVEELVEGDGGFGLGGSQGAGGKRACGEEGGGGQESHVDEEYNGKRDRADRNGCGWHTGSMAVTPDLRECLCLHLRRSARQMTQFYDERLRASGLRTTQFQLLSAVAKMGSTAQQPLAEFMGMDRTTLTRNLALLKREGLVLLERAAGDRRERVISLTAEGGLRLARAMPLWLGAQEEMRRRMSEDAGLPAFVEVLALLRRVDGLGGA